MGKLTLSHECFRLDIIEVFSSFYGMDVYVDSKVE